MHDKNRPASAIRAAAALGTLLVVLGVVWWLVVLATDTNGATSVASTQRSVAPDRSESDGAERSEEASAPSTATARAPTPVERRLVMLSEPVLFDSDMGTGSTEFSAVTLNEDSGRLVVADDEGMLFEFDLDDQGIPITPPRRSIVVEVGDSDIEGLAWISGTTYVIAHEATGDLSVVTIEPDQRRVGAQHLSRVIQTEVRAIEGAGIEGVTSVESIDDVEFVVVIERPPSLSFIDDDGVITMSVPLRLGAEDVADVWAAPDASLWVVSDLGQVLVRLDVSADGNVRQLQQVDLVFSNGEFAQPEGLVVSRDGERLYVVGESPGPGQFSLGVWRLN